VVGTTYRQLNLSQLHSHIGSDLHSDISELMTTCACPSNQQLGLLVVHYIWRDLFLDVSLAFIVIHGGARGQGEVDALKQGGWFGGGGFIDIP
jgi:hypothetical protein